MNGYTSYFGLSCTVAVPRLYLLTATVTSGAATALGRADVAVVAVPSAAAVINAPAGSLTLTLAAYRYGVSFSPMLPSHSMGLSVCS